MNEFRVWCNNKNEWEQDELALLSTGQLWDMKMNRCVREDSHIVEFATGIRDKNKNMVFVGDVVKLYELRDGGLEEYILTIKPIEDDTLDITAWCECDNGTGWGICLTEMVIVDGSPQRDIEIIGHVHEGDK